MDGAVPNDRSINATDGEGLSQRHDVFKVSCFASLQQIDTLVRVLLFHESSKPIAELADPIPSLIF